MGVVYSVDSVISRCGDISGDNNEELLRSSSARVNNLVACYLKFQYPPMVDNINLHSYFMNVEKTAQLNTNQGSQVAILWKVYEVQSM